MVSGQTLGYAKKVWIKLWRNKKKFLLITGFLLFMIHQIFYSSIMAKEDSNGAVLILFYVLFHNICGEILWEKQTKMKEVLQIMGLNWKSYFAGYFIVEGLIGTIFSLIVSILTVFDKNFSVDQGMLYFVGCMLNVVNIIGLAFTISTLASTQRFGSFLQWILYFGPLFLSSMWESLTNIYLKKAIMILFPFRSFFISQDLIYKKKTLQDSELIQAWGSQLVPLLISWVLFIYLEQVFPSGYGVKKSPIFFLKRNSVKRNLEQEEQKGLMENEFISINKITKKYGKVFALNEVTMGMNIGEVFCILGPNGAGKTTLINLLLGMSTKHSGSIKVNKIELSDNIDLIHSRTGYCPQETIIYEDLTVEEHLLLMQAIKGSAENHHRILEALTLLESKDKLAGTLSGGQKRKLVVGMSFIGNSNIIVLDEPTIGMDTESRQGLWSMILENKNDRLVILTTQNLQEADELANRICILNAGELVEDPQAPVQWKAKYGQGYKLILESKNGRVEKAILSELISRHISDCTLCSSSLNRVEFLLPTTAQNKYSNLFKELEANTSYHMTLEYSSMEDTYLNISKLFSKKEQEMKEISGTEYADPEPLLKIDQPISIFSQTIILIQTKLLILRRNWKRWLESIIPLALILLSYYGFFNDKTDTGMDFVNYIVDYLFTLFITASFSSFLCNSIYSPVLEKKQQIKHMLTVYNIRPISYWAAHLVFELLISFVVVFLCVIIIWFLGLCTMLFESTLLFLGILFAYAVATVCWSAPLSFLFNDPQTAYSMTRIFYLLISFMIPSLFSLIPYQSSIDLVGKVDILFSYTPLYAFYYSLTELRKRSFKEGWDKFEIFKNDKDTSALHYINSASQGLLCIIFSAIFAIIMTMILEMYFANKKNKAEEYDIKKEQKSIKSKMSDSFFQKNEKKPMMYEVKQLSKVYSDGFEALRKVNLKAEKGIVCGILGPNGAGKSTLFNISSQILRRSAGEIYLDSKNIYSDKLAFHSIGLCPQNNISWEYLTVEEHISLIAKLRGMDSTKAKSQTNSVLHLLNLENEKTKFPFMLSGGNLRKLSTAIAIISCPNCAFFDEPSVGLDPENRQKMWNALKLMLKSGNNSILMSTHRMDEAETYCDYLAILICGQIFAVGTPAQLKHHYGKGYKVYIPTENSIAENSIAQYFERKFSLSEEKITVNPTSGFIEIEIEEEGIKFSEIWDDIYNPNTPFIVTHKSLEHIFSKLSKLQMELSSKTK